MGRTPISGAPVLLRLKAKGHRISVFGYSTTVSGFDAIRDRLRSKIIQVAARGDYVLVGHSLGGVLLRSALNGLPREILAPKHLFLLGSPVRSSRLARGLKARLVYRALAGDSGQLLASDPRMDAIGPAKVQTTIIIGTRGMNGRRSPFLDEPNDGVVAQSEARADWATDEVFVPVIHTLLPASTRVATIILQRLAAKAS
jgi:hypothetical protein